MGLYLVFVGLVGLAMNTAQVLRAAAARVRKGWCQNTYRDCKGNVCCIGALAEVKNVDAKRLHDNEIVDPACRAVWKALDVTIADWNDGEGQTAENVASGLELAAVVWEQAQAQNTVADVQAAPALTSTTV